MEDTWWKLCNHPLVIGLHRLIVIVATPLIVAFISWAASSFDQMRLAVARLDATVTLGFAHTRDVTDDLARRVETLEARP